MIQMCVCDHNRIERVKREQFGSAQVRGGAIVVGRYGDATIDQYLTLPGGQQGRASAHLPVASQSSHAKVGLVVKTLAHQSAPHTSQELLPLFLDLPEIVPYLTDGLGRDRGCSDHLRCPSNLLLDLVQHRTVLADDESGRYGLDRDLSCVILEVDIGDLRLFRDDLLYAFLGAGRIGQQVRVRPDGHPSPKRLRKLSHEIIVLGELIEVLRVDHNDWTLEIYLRHFDMRRYCLLDRISCVF